MPVTHEVASSSLVVPAIFYLKKGWGMMNRVYKITGIVLGSVLLLLMVLYELANFYCAMYSDQFSWFNSGVKNKVSFYLENRSCLFNNSLKFDKEKAAKDLLSDEYAEQNENVEDYSGKFRPIENENADKSILIFGGSYAYGQNLASNTTFSHKLGKLLPNYMIVNRAKCLWTTSHMLYQIENKKFASLNVKYVVYIFNPFDIIDNNSANNIGLYPYYAIKGNNDLKLLNYSTRYYYCPLFLTLRSFANRKYGYGFYYRLLTKEIIADSIRYSNLKFGDGVKFIILNYDTISKESFRQEFCDLCKLYNDLIVVNLYDISDSNYNSIEYMKNWFPTEKAWNEITPLFVKYLQDRGYLKD